MSKNNITPIKEADDIRAKLKPLEDNLSKIAGIPVELTLRSAEKRSYTISFDGDNPDAQSKLKAYFGTGAKWGDCGYDAGSEATFMYFDAPAGTNESTDSAEPQHFKTLVDIKPGKYTKGSKEYDSLMWHRENEPYKLTTLPGLKPNIKGISYNKKDDEWSINESTDDAEPDGQSFIGKTVLKSSSKSGTQQKYKIDGYSKNGYSLRGIDGCADGVVSSSELTSRFEIINEAKNVDGSLEDNLTKYGQDFEKRGDDIFVKDGDMTFTPNGDGTYTIENPAATIDYKANVLRCLIVLDLENEPGEINEDTADSYTEEERKKIANEYETIQYENTTEEAINKLAEKYAYGDFNTIVSVLKKAGIKLQSFKNGSLEDMFPNIKEAALPKDEAGLTDTGSPQYIAMVSDEYKKLVDQYNTAPTPELLAQLNSCEEFLKLTKTEPIKESLTQVEYLRIRKEPMARLYEFNASKKLYVLKEEKKIVSKHIGSVMVQEGKQYLVNMYGVTQLCTYTGKVDENHIFAPVNDPSATISGTTNEFRCNIRSIKEAMSHGNPQSIDDIKTWDDLTQYTGVSAEEESGLMNAVESSNSVDEMCKWIINNISDKDAQVKLMDYYMKYWGIEESVNEEVAASEPAEIFIDGYPYYLSKMGDTTHFEMVNTKEGVGIGGICVHHVGEFRDHPMYDDLTKWLKGGEDMNGKQYGKANESTAKKTGVNEQRTFTMIKEDKGKYQRINEQDEVWDIGQFKQHLEDEAGNYHMAYPEDRESLLQWLQDNSTKLPYSIGRFQSVIGGNSEWHTADSDDVDSMLTAVGMHVNEGRGAKKINEAAGEPEQTMTDAIKKAKEIIASGTTAWEDVKTELAKTFTDFQGAELDMAIDKAKQPGSIYDVNESLSITSPEEALEFFRSKNKIPKNKTIKLVKDGDEDAWQLDGYDTVKNEVSTYLVKGKYDDYEWALETGEGDFIVGINIDGKIEESLKWSADEMKKAIKENIGWYALDDVNDKQKVLEWLDANRPNIADFDTLRTKISENTSWCTDDDNHVAEMLEGYNAIGSGPEFAANEEVSVECPKCGHPLQQDQLNVLRCYNKDCSEYGLTANVKQPMDEDKMPDGKDKALFVSEKDAVDKLGAESAGEDENGQKMYKIDGTKYIIVDGTLHTLSGSEPDCPVRKTVFKQLNEAAGDDETTFNDMDCIVDTESINDVLVKHGVGADEINHYSSDLFRIPSKYVTSDLIDELFAIGVKQA